ncbi:MAG: M20/M25/M40 family metallo-hydrolase [Acidobacteria bacterium]|nr:M20/M25/M40 family metallo-hydrolase [Acidobacteriota bacterium]MBS1865476.1 M20/M25/M40 family metallo-hydrolase [Acidobacteriota bacterium]
MSIWARMATMAAVGLLFSGAAVPQRSDAWSNWEKLVRTPSVSGHEEMLARHIRERLKGYDLRTDNLGNVIVTIGSGSPHRLFVTPMDQPGYVVSGIRDDGFLRVQRLPQAAPNGSFDALHFAQPIVVTTRSGKTVPGVFGGLSVHLELGRQNVPKMTHLDEMFVDIGARSAEEARASGVDGLDSVSLERLDNALGNEAYAGSGIADRAGVVALVELLEQVEASKTNVQGTLTVAFVTQSWTGGRGLERLLNEVHPDEMIYVGKFQAPKNSPQERPTAKSSLPGTGILLGVADASSPLTGYASELNEFAKKQGVAIRVESAADPKISGYAAATPLPKRFAQLGVPVLFPTSPAETISYKDIDGIEQFLFLYVGGQRNAGGVGGGFASGCGDCGPPLPGILTETYGPSGHEGLVREKIKELLPEWARKKVETDAAGNLVLHVGPGKKNAKTPSIAFVAHMDEIGYEIKKIEDDGRLRVGSIGGGYPQYFLGHAVRIQKSDGTAVGGVMELPEGWDKPGFEWPLSLRGMDEGLHVYVGTKAKEETEKLGIKVGDWMTIPKEYRPMIGTRANARSFDDRVGCAALVEAVRALGPNPDAAVGERDVTFVWSTEEEVGLKGAAAFAEQAAKDGRVPDFVFAIDTFVSSDSPLEEKRFADAELGKGFVVRAVDNSNVTPLEYVDHLVKLARENKIPVQYGVTGGGNDGAVFTRYGSVDVALGWPLRYSHSPGEVIDTKDSDALGKIVEAIAKNW